MTRGTEISNAIIASLEAINPAGGYLTDAGTRVHVGRADHLDDTQAAEFPAILVRCVRDGVGASQPKHVRHVREIAVEGYVFPDDPDYEAVMDALAEDIHRSLQPQGTRSVLGGLAIELDIEGAEYVHPEPGSRLAAVTYAVTVQYATTYINDQQ
ncbi:hypothetical protein [Thioalkalivibrio sp. ALJ8]|uniref:hypothetical protein n=1 Tax=Thioalkalivibrio sp. ALJ8 TaxID=1158757 RepID=UPI00037A22C6|nr:hypothetical protein [Thioalkalivibrio sp. ALJ8]